MRKLVLGGAVFVAAFIMLVGGKKAHAQSTQTNPPPPPQTVTVQSGDSLSKIATENSSTYPRIYSANAQIQDPNLIYPGDNLRIPAADEQLPDRPLPGPVTAAPVQAAPAPRAAAGQAVSAPVQYSGSGDVWDRLAACESGGNWHINTGNGYYGGLQFSLGSWRGVGGAGLPSDASREEQIARAQILQSRSGWGAWPACSTKLGLR